MSELIEAKQLAVLQSLKDYFLESGVATHLLEKSETLPVSVLVVVIGRDFKDRERTINFAFLPVREDDFQHVSGLQFFSTLPNVEYNPEDKGIAELLLTINHKTALGNYSYTAGKEIALRHIHFMPKFGITPKEEFIEVAMLFKQMLDLFGPKIEAYTEGVRSLRDTMIDLNM
jgi:hypothetical protein